jgi:hypothetical protein
LEVRGWKFDVGGSGFEVRGTRFEASKFEDHENGIKTCFVHAEAREEC